MIDEDDDLDWDLWMEMTDAEHDAILARETRRYNEWWDSLTPLQQYRSSRRGAARRGALEGCLTWRKSIAWMGAANEPGGFFDEQLRNRQKRLVKLRIWRTTGVYPGSA